MLGVHVDERMFVGVDPRRYDPMPLGVSVELKDSDLARSRGTGWHVWERYNRPGRRRDRDEGDSFETLVGFTPERFIDYVRFERRATSLGLDPGLRARAAEIAVRGERKHSTPAGGSDAPGRARGAAGSGAAGLLELFELTSTELVEIIERRMRLRVAVSGGVAEHHLARVLRRDPAVSEVEPIDRDGQPDLRVTLADGRRVTVECKNVSTKRFRGAPRVEVQKTRSQIGDKSGRFYRPEQFDVVAASLFPVTSRWELSHDPTDHSSGGGDSRVVTASSGSDPGYD